MLLPFYGFFLILAVRQVAPQQGIKPTSPALEGKVSTTGLPVKSQDGKFYVLSQFSSVTQLCPTLFSSMDCSTPGVPVFHHLWRLLKLVSIESVMPSNHLVLYCPLLLLPSVFPSIKFFSNESVLFALCGQSIGVSASASVNIQDWFPLGWTGWISLQSKGLSRVFSNITVQEHQFFIIQLSLRLNSHNHSIYFITK